MFSHLSEMKLGNPEGCTFRPSLAALSPERWVPAALEDPPGLHLILEGASSLWVHHFLPGIPPRAVRSSREDVGPDLRDGDVSHARPLSAVLLPSLLLLGLGSGGGKMRRPEYRPAHVGAPSAYCCCAKWPFLCRSCRVCPARRGFFSYSSASVPSGLGRPGCAGIPSMHRSRPDVEGVCLHLRTLPHFAASPGTA